LTKWFNGLSNEIKDKIKGISTDINKWYKNVAELKIPGIVGTVDKYHLFQEANRMVDDVRAMTIWLIKKWFMTEEDFIKRKKVTPGMIKKKEKSKN
jgi:transposase